MAYRPTCLEDSLDPWLDQESDPTRRLAVLDWLQELCESNGRIPGRPVQGMSLPTFAAMVPGREIVVVWVVVDQYEQIAVRRLFDVRSRRWFGQ